MTDGPARLIVDVDGNIVTTAGDGSDRRLQVESLLVPRGVVSANETGNSSVTTLAADAEFVGTAEQVRDYAMAVIVVKASHASAVDGLVLETSPDGTNWDSIDEFTIPANKGKIYTSVVGNWFRVRYKNGSTTQTFFRLQIVYKQFYGKPSSHRISDSIVDDDDAELVKAILTGKKPDGIFDNIELEADSRLRVSIPPPASPPGTTPVNRFVSGSIGSGSTSEDIYTITDGKTLILQRFSAGADGSIGGGRGVLVERTTGGDSILDLLYLNANNFQRTIGQEFVGDGDRRIVIQRTNGTGSPLHMTASWVGYEE
jgi:hypothetical protein